VLWIGQIEEIEEIEEFEEDLGYQRKKEEVGNLWKNGQFRYLVSII